MPNNSGALACAAMRATIRALSARPRSCGWSTSSRAASSGATGAAINALATTKNGTPTANDFVTKTGTNVTDTAR